MKSELTADERKRWARTLYVREAKTISEVANEVSVDEATIRGWINESSWDMVRKSLSISKAKQLEHLYDLTEQLSSELKNSDNKSKDVDLLLKYTTTIRNLEVDNSVYATLEAGEDFLAWLYRKNLPFAQEVTREFDIFVKERQSL